MSNLDPEEIPVESVAAPRAVKRPRPRAAYALPTLFTAGNIFLGYLSIVNTIQGALAFTAQPALAQQDFEVAAKTIGLAVVLDGLDGRIARMTNTTSEFGRELDSLADVISFGIAPAILAYVWGVMFATNAGGSFILDHLQRLGKLLAFLFLACGAARLARFNIQKNPMPSNPGAPHRRYFVGLPIPAGAGMVAAVIFAMGSIPVTDPWWSVAWVALLGLLSFLMISAWRYWSFKELNLLRPRSPVILVLMCLVIYAIWNWARVVLLVLASIYVSSGIVIRVGGIIRRGGKPRPPMPAPHDHPEAQIG
ncbi:MAG TPA: CDP-diacylglycerol--serine O-phosphatidyltransferase [Bryobacteraceae bacterium]|nr:CDP-diacylglycerol--serine O-phosphatidyltransferase [Bryobacteraceae bacterium]